MSSRTKNDLFRENEKLLAQVARFEKRQASFLKNEQMQCDEIDRRDAKIRALSEEITEKAHTIAAYRLTVMGQSRILSNTLFPKVKASMEPSE